MILYFLLSSSFNQLAAPEKRFLEINHGASQILSITNPSTRSLAGYATWGLSWLPCLLIENSNGVYLTGTLLRLNMM